LPIAIFVSSPLDPTTRTQVPLYFDAVEEPPEELLGVVSSSFVQDTDIMVIDSNTVNNFMI
jgi:hypothetical protein